MNQGGLEEMLWKVRDKNTTEDELVAILADVLFEGFLWQYEHPEGEKTPYVNEEKK